MASTSPSFSGSERKGLFGWLRENATLLFVILLMAVLPFLIALLQGQSFADLLTNTTGTSKFWQGLLIEIFILGIYAISYDLVLGITGLLSFGHAMFFAVGAYTTGIALKTFEFGIVPTLILIVIAGVVQALLFGLVLPRVKGITFALVTLGMASVFQIVIQSREMGDLTGADVGLQGVISPEFLNTNTQRLRLYFIVLIITLIVYLIYRRFVNSPTGRVCIAIRENEERAQMLGYNTFYFKLVVLIISSITAALAGALHTIHQPIVSPTIAGLNYTIVALLIILIGGMGTLSGAIVGAAIFRLLSFLLDKWFGESAAFLLGLVYVALVIFIPFGIVGTWQLRSFRLKQGWQRLRERLLGSGLDA